MTIVERYVLDSLSDREREIEHAGNWLSSVRQDAQDCPSLSAVDLVELAQEAGLLVELSWARQYSQRGGLDAIFHNHLPVPAYSGSRVMYRFPVDHHGRPSHSLVSQPLRQHLQEKAREQVYELLQAKLPCYMVPQRILVLDRMPLNQNGKIDRIALKQSLKKQTMQRQAAQPAQQQMTEAEQQMQKIWAEILNMEPGTIRLDDNFFTLGGNSFTAMKVVSTCCRTGLELTIQDIISHPALRDVARQRRSPPID